MYYEKKGPEGSGGKTFKNGTYLVAHDKKFKIVLLIYLQ